ncbi:hypothetical protein CF326_g2421 [Tilletia indica]|uniref:Uncharacterized protein n=1 Tax=Tilletia indica TaxID=43049 RepID=A0A177T7P9_9BASI|nr:hypothetical protein CF326_g2421 [Tilletia indica]KAE8250850.1 hypothetical protein A4X13_0g4321 [Tilletia indica]
MDARPAPTTWRCPVIAGLPTGLQQGAEGLQGAYVNSGRMSGGLARIQLAAMMFSRAIVKNTDGQDLALHSVSESLAAMHSDVTSSLTYAQTRLDLEVDEFKARMTQDLTETRLTIDRRVKSAVEAVKKVLQTLDGNANAELQDAIAFLKRSGTDLEKDVNATETDYMTCLAQIIVFISWTNAWPTALRTIQDVQGSGEAVFPPPGYVHDSMTGQERTTNLDNTAGVPGGELD